MFTVCGNEFSNEKDAVAFACATVNSRTCSCRVEILEDGSISSSIDTKMTHGDKPLMLINYDGSTEVNPELSQSEIDSKIAAYVSSNTERLWMAATRWEQQYISGSAPSMVALGVASSKPKSLAVTAWIQGLWSDYYARKASISHDMPESSFDFSNHGPIPFSVPELMQEVLQ